MSFTERQVTSEAIGEHLRRAEEIARAQQKPKAARELAEAADKLKTGTFNLVILGQFKRGKSTLINALIGAPVLPMGVIPLTSIATKISYGDRLGAKVFFENGTEKAISMDEVPEYVTEAQNPVNEKGVASVEITYPSPYLKNGVVLIDTPGVGSVHQHNTDVAYEWLAKADAAFFLVSSDPPISKDEVEFLKTVTEYAGKIFFVQNKVDRLTADERDETLAFCESVLAPLFPAQQVRVYPVSAKLALEGKVENDKGKLAQSLLPALERDLEKFLLRGKADVLALSVCRAGLRALNEIELALAVEERALTLSQTELVEKAATLDEFLEKVEQDKADMLVLLRAEVQEIQADLARDVEQVKKDATSSLLTRLQEQAASSAVTRLTELEKKLTAEMRSRIVAIMDEFREKEADELLARFARVQKRFVEKTNDILNRVNALVTELFALELEPVQMVETLAVRDDFYYMLDKEPPFFPIEPKIFRRLLPRFLAQRLLLSDVKNRAEQLVDRQSGRVRYDFAQRIESTAGSFRERLTETIEGVTEGLKEALTAAREKRATEGEEAEQALKRLNGEIAKLKAVKGGFAEIERKLAGSEILK